MENWELLGEKEVGMKCVGNSPAKLFDHNKYQDVDKCETIPLNTNISKKDSMT